jgi:NADPH-dependent glutamate synthase beta subunit-like oxidoreductase
MSLARRAEGSSRAIRFAQIASAAPPPAPRKIAEFRASFNMFDHLTRIGQAIALGDLFHPHPVGVLGIGLAKIPAQGLEIEDGSLPAVGFMSKLRQARDLSILPIGRDGVVVGGGVTAIDATVLAS